MTGIEVKICGLTSAADAAAAWEAGADYLGFVLYRGSPRGIPAETLRDIRADLPAGARVVAVFVNEAADRVRALARECRLAAVQVHGDEAPEGYRDMPVPVWRAVRYMDGAWQPDPAGRWSAARYVVDAHAPAQYGGTGRRADWPAAAVLARHHVCMLAGGLRPENVAEAIRAVHPAGVDVCGGVEAVPGRKDRRKMEEFVTQAKAADGAARGGEARTG